MCLFRTAATDIAGSTDQGSTVGRGDALIEKIIVFATGAFTVITGALIMYMNDKPPRQKFASRLYYIGSSVLAFISFALLIASLTLFYSRQAADQNNIEMRPPMAAEDVQRRLENHEEETLRLLLNMAIVFVFILLFTMAILYILFIVSCSKAVVCHGADGNRGMMNAHKH